MSDEQKPSGVIATVDRALRIITLVFGGAALAFMTLFSVWNVLVMRKAFNSPILGAEDILVLTLVATVALSIPLGARAGAHIEIEVLESRMSAAFAKWSLVLVKLLGVALLVTMAWRLWHAGQSAGRFGEATQQLLLSYEPFYYVLSCSMGLYAFILLLDIWQMFTTGKIAKLKIGSDGL